MLEKKADLNILNREYKHSLLVALENKNVSFGIIKLLVESKCHMNENESNNLNYTIQIALENDWPLSTIQYLVENKSALDTKNRQFDTPLHTACAIKETPIEIIKYLVENKSDLNSKNNRHFLPLHFECEKFTLDVDKIKYLVEKKSDLNSLDYYQHFTPLQIFLKNKNVPFDLLQFFVENKSDLNLKFKDG